MGRSESTTRKLLNLGELFQRACIRGVPSFPDQSVAAHPFLRFRERQTAMNQVCCCAGGTTPEPGCTLQQDLPAGLDIVVDNLRYKLELAKWDRGVGFLD